MGACRSFFLLLSSHRRCRLLECRLFACYFLIVVLRWLVLGVVWRVVSYRAVLFGCCRQVILVRCFSVVGGASSVIRVVVMSCLSCLCVWCRVCLFVRSTFFTLVFALLCCVVGFFV